ncbi:hypothetical protein TSOC_001706, partial [Tetrabaena socialis]
MHTNGASVMAPLAANAASRLRPAPPPARATAPPPARLPSRARATVPFPLPPPPPHRLSTPGRVAGASPAGGRAATRCKTVSGRGSRPRLHRLACRAASGDELVFAPDSGSGSGSGLGARRHALDLGMDPLAVGTQVYGPAERLVLDAQPAEAFFGVARTGVAHTDAGFVRQLHGVYGQALEPLSGQSSALLDLCSSWASHLPTGLRFGQVIGHGMNADELAANGALTSTFVQDLNERPSLPLPAASVDAVLVCNGLQYLVRPEWVAAEVARVLKPGGAVVAAFSDACWLERAAAGWLSRGPAERLQLVARLREGAGLGVVESISRPSAAPGSDAFYAVVARKAPLEDAHGGQGAGAAAGGGCTVEA